MAVHVEQLPGGDVIVSNNDGDEVWFTDDEWTEFIERILLAHVRKVLGRTNDDL